MTSELSTSGIDEKTWSELEEIAARYPQKRSGLLPMLHLVQAVEGQVTPAGIEACADILGISAAEVVISVRGRSGSYLHADLMVGGVAALSALAFMLFSPHPFGLVWLLVDPFLVGGAVALAASRLMPHRRALTARLRPLRLRRFGRVRRPEAPALRRADREQRRRHGAPRRGSSRGRRPCRRTRC